MPVQGLEPTIDAAEASLKDPATGLNARIAEINAEHDDFDLDPVPADAFYPGGWTLLKYPCVEYAIADFDASDLPLGQTDWAVSTPYILRIWMSDARAEPGRLYRRALRYAAAAMRVLMQPGAFGANAQLNADRPVRGALRFNPETEERDEVEAAALLVFYLDSIDARL